MSRFEVREHRTPLVLVRRFPDLERVTYKVYDNQTGKVVPFGSYSDKGRAQARADHEEAKVNGS